MISRSTPSHPYANELFLHYVAGKMLFPKCDENFTSYLCLGIDDVLSMMVRDGTSPDKAFSFIYSIVLTLFSEEVVTSENTSGKKHAHDATFFFNSGRNQFPWEKYGYYLRNSRFPIEGKGSISERITRGKFAGFLLNIALKNNLSLTKAAENFEKNWNINRPHLNELLGNDPLTISADNFMQNIWPEFKKSAHLWAAFQDFTFDLRADPLGFKFSFFRLSDITEFGGIICLNQDNIHTNTPTALWPSKYSGWRSLIYKSNYILTECTKRGNTKNSPKPLLLASDCWQFSIPPNK